MTNPERLARIAVRAREAARFHIPINDRTGAESARDIYWRVMQPLIGAATSCRLFDVPRQERVRLAPKAASPVTAHYLKRSRGRIEVDMNHAGVRDDVDFWWSIVDNQLKRPMFTVPLNRVDSVALGSSGDCAVFATLKYDLPSSAVEFAKSQVADGDEICLLPIVHGVIIQAEVLRLVVFAAPDVAATLAQASLTHAVNADKPHELDRPAALDRGSPGFVYGALDLKYKLDIIGIGGGDPERRLQTLLCAVSKRGDWASIQKALAAAEVIAAIEKRPIERHKWSSANSIDAAYTVEKWAEDQDMLSEETVRLAQATIASISPEQATDPTILTAELRKSMEGSWRLWLGDLTRRLDAAVLARRVRASSPNAAPPVLTRKTLAQLAKPEAWSAFDFYALREDAQAVLDFVREETGARIYTTTADGSLRERTSSWDCREALSEAFDGHFDDRRIVVWRDHKSGIKFRVWWPDVSPPPLVRGRPRPADSAGEKLLQELTVHPRPPESSLEVVGWGITAFLFRGGMGIGDPQWITDGRPRILRSVFEYPTGRELRRPRYRITGPWSEVDWKALRKKIRQVRAHITGPLSRGTAPTPGKEPVLEYAAIRRNEGWKLADKDAHAIRPRKA